MSWSAQALCLLLLAAPAWGQVAIPDTPAGENLGAMLSALNSTDESAIEQYIEKYGRGENATNLAQMARRIGYLRLEKIIKSERLRLQYLVHSETLGLQLLAMLEVEDADPPRVSFSLPWLPVPADAAVIGFDVDTATRSSVIREVAAALAEEYVLPEHAAAMADALIEKLESGGYDDVTNGWVLANVLTQDLRSVYDDKHLVVGFSPIEAGPPMPGLFAVQPTQVGASCGLERPQDLEDGIGYVKISLFADPSTCGAEAIDALASLRSTRAIVFDLRDAVGGHAGMVALMLAHLFDEAPDMSSLHRRSSVSEFSLPFAGFNLADKLVYILTSERTFSAAEWFAYDLQALDRATIVGAATGGGAHAARLERIDERFQVNLPYARAVNPITAENWEKTGVIPDVSAEASDALDVALALIRRAEER